MAVGSGGWGKTGRTKCMLKSACLAVGPQLESHGVLPSALDLLTALSTEQWEQLTAFARRRLVRVRITPARQQHLAGLTGEDLIGEVVAKVLLGDRHPRKGRPLRPQHRVGAEALLNRLRGDINSELSNRLAKADTRGEHLSLSNETAVAVASSHPARELARRELQAALFARLRELTRTEAVLQPLIDHWERHFLEADRIGDAGQNRNHTHRLRRHAQRVLRELAEEMDEPDGRGMVV